MSAHDWSRFVLRIPITSTPQRIAECWNTRAGLESWFLRKAAFTKKDGKPRNTSDKIEIGDSYEWLWYGWSDEMIEKGTIISTAENEIISFSFGKAGNVTVRTKMEEGEQILELEQYSIPMDENAQVNYHIGCTKGWLFYLTNLKSILEGGIDLRNRNVNLTNVINS